MNHPSFYKRLSPHLNLTSLTGRVVISFLSLTLAISLWLPIPTGQAASTAGAVDPTFMSGSGPNGSVNSIAVQSDGKVLIGGQFTTYNDKSRNRLARLNTDGTLDTGFNVGTGTDNNVQSLAIQSDGKIVIGGNFTSYNGTGRNYLARLNSDGTLDTSFNIGTGTDNSVNSVAVQSDGKILIGGNFASYNGTARSRLARLNADGTLDTGFSVGAGADNSVNSIAVQSDGKVLVGGTFISYNGTIVDRITRLNTDGTLDNSFSVGAGADNNVNSIAVQSDGKILIGGLFTIYNDIGRNYIARLNTDGSLDNSFNVGTGADGGVNSISVQSDGKVLIGGDFVSYDGTLRNYIARLNADGSLDSNFTIGTGADNTVRNLAIQSDGKILIGGIFSSYNGIIRNRLARLNADGTLDTGFNIGNVGGAGANSSVLSLAIQSDGKIVIGGNFTKYNGTTVNRITRLNTDGTLDNGFNVGGAGAGSTVNSVAVQSDGKIIIGGNFTSCIVAGCNRLARLNADGSFDTSFNMGNGASNTVNSIVVQNDGKVLIGGNFTSYNGTTVNRIARLNADGTLDTGFNVGGAGAGSTVNSVAVQSDGKILIVGIFSSYNGTSRNRLARLNPDGSLDTSFNVGTGINGNVNSVAVQSDGKILIGGNFTNYNGTTINRIIRLNTDGTLDTGFNVGTGADNNVQSVAVQSDGKVVIGGSFTNYNGTPINRIMRLNTDGTLDTGFNVGTGANSTVSKAAIQSDGKILIVGSFTSVDTYTRDFVARLEGVTKIFSSVTLSSSNPSQYGQSITFTATTTPITATGTVTFIFGSGASSTNVTSTLVSGIASYVTSTLPVGNTPVQASYAGDAAILASTSPVYTQTVTKIPTSLAVTGSPNPSPYHQNATFTATVQPTQATGTVTFTIGTSSVSVTLSGGVASYITNTLASGDYAVSASYSGSSTYSSTTSSSSYTHTVSQPVRGAIHWQQSSYSVGEAGGSAIVTATRTGGADGAIEATIVITSGTATSADYSSPASFVLGWEDGESGARTFQLPIVNDTTYEGNESLTLGLTNPEGGASLGSPATTTLTIVEDDLPATNLALMATPNPSQYGQSVTFTATVSALAPGTGTPGGTVTFLVDGASAVAVNLASGQASYMTTTLLVGSHNVTASYSGSSQYLASQASITQTVEQAPVSVSLASVPNPAVVGTSVTFSATIQPLSATGVVTFTFNGLTQTARPVVNGVATYVTSTLAVGSHNVTAIYGGDANYYWAASQLYTQTIVAACNPQVVSSTSDDGQANTCGTLSYALASTTSGTITFALTNGNTITFTGSLTPMLKAGVALDGGVSGVVLNGNGVAGNGLRLGGANTLTNLTIKSFGGQELLATVSSWANHLFKVKVQS